MVPSKLPWWGERVVRLAGGLDPFLKVKFLSLVISRDVNVLHALFLSTNNI